MEMRPIPGMGLVTRRRDRVLLSIDIGGQMINLNLAPDDARSFAAELVTIADEIDAPAKPN